MIEKGSHKHFVRFFLIGEKIAYLSLSLSFDDDDEPISLAGFGHDTLIGLGFDTVDQKCKAQRDDTSFTTLGQCQISSRV